MTWKALLGQAINTIGQAEVARRLGVSPSTVSMVSRDQYPASTEAIEAKILEIFGGRKVETIPEGYIKNSKGHLVPIADLSQLDLQRDQLVRELESRARSLSRSMAASKRSWLGEIQAHIQLAADQYQVTVGGESGTVTLLSYDGLIRVERQYSRSLAVNERVAIAKELVSRYVREKSNTLDAETKQLLLSAFRVDEKGQFSASALLSLSRLIKSSSPDWQAAVAAINDSVTTEYGDPYVRVYVRDEKGIYNQIPLDFSAV